MVRFLHTADVQLAASGEGDSPGLRRRREARFEALKSALAVAREEEVDFAVICGDLFESNLVSNEAVHRALHLFQQAAPLPIFILPGNHDPYSGSGSVYLRPSFVTGCPENVRLLSTPDPVPVAADCTLYPCPVTAKTSLADPTQVIPPRTRDDEIRVGLAHGSLKIESKYQDYDHPIPLDAWRQRDLDYLALGHWHSHGVFEGRRVAYSGTPEQTNFGEADAGNVLLVTISGRGAVPTITPRRVGVLQWLEWRRQVREPVAERLETVRGEVRAIGAPERTLLRLVLEGTARADSLPLIQDFEEWLAQAGLVASEVIRQIALLETLEGALRRLVESDDVAAGVAADLHRLATLDAGGGSPPTEVAPRPVELLMDTWRECLEGSRKGGAKYPQLSSLVKDVPAVEVAQDALVLLARLAQEVLG